MYTIVRGVPQYFPYQAYKWWSHYFVSPRTTPEKAYTEAESKAGTSGIPSPDGTCRTGLITVVLE